MAPHGDEQVKSIESAANNKYKGVVTDGKDSMPCIFVSQFAEVIEAGSVHAGCTIKVCAATTASTCNPAEAGEPFVAISLHAAPACLTDSMSLL